MAIRELVNFARANFSGRLNSRQGQAGAQADDLPELPGWLTDDAVPIAFPPASSDNDADRQVAVGAIPVIYGEHQDNAQGPAGLSSDMLAYYLPYHLYDDASWGIYVREHGLEILAAALNGGTLKPGDDGVVMAAYVALFQHEFFHCLVESVATRIEAVTSSATYRGHFDSAPSREHEEAVANASALNRFGKRYSPLTTTLAGWMATQPD